MQPGFLPRQDRVKEVMGGGQPVATADRKVGKGTGCAIKFHSRSQLSIAWTFQPSRALLLILKCASAATWLMWGSNRAFILAFNKGFCCTVWLSQAALDYGYVHPRHLHGITMYLVLGDSAVVHT